ncbi:HNH endonuclease signature motif containing protein [Acrocarpospora sp. B8E8]|uniref:HNH endonuclease signature motif containing protein n=1 Tax=Acrocarpospora sp. B8E8 TaxID=3153572 RepID=UPI00325D7CC5
MLRRHIQIRDRTCTFTGCRMPATRTDQDHIHDHSAGGPTTAHNLASACRHDHRAKHIGGWRIAMPHPGRVVWLSPLGHLYPVRTGQIIDPAIDPLPRAQRVERTSRRPDGPVPDPVPDHDTPTMPPPPPARKPLPPQPRRPAHDHGEDIPPF